MNQKTIDIQKRTEKLLIDYAKLKNRSTKKGVKWTDILEYKDMAVRLGTIIDDVENVIFAHYNDLCMEDMLSLFTSYVDLTEAQKVMSVLYEHWISGFDD